MVSPRGELDIDTAPDLREQLRGVIDGNPGAAVQVDLADVSFMDSTGLAVLLFGLRRSTESGGSLCVLNASPRVQKLLDITGTVRLLCASA